MPHQLLLGLDLALSVVGAALWVVAGILATRQPGGHWPKRVALTLAGLATLAVVGRVLIVVAVSAAGWWFIEEKVLLALPLAIITALFALVVSVPAIVRTLRNGHSPVTPATVVTGLLAAGYGSAVGVITTLIVGYPVSLYAAISIVILLALLIAITWAVLAERGPRLIGGLTALAVLALVSSAGYGWLTTTAGATEADASHGHGVGAEPVEQASSVSVSDLRTPPMDATVRHTLEAQRQAVDLPSGTTVNAWTFGALPGPPITARQGDVVEVELRNRDIDEGVTLHWHGVDVPNGEDGVAGVTQDAVLPGEKFVYRFVAEDTGTYWYHTHQHSAEGVRRGLYGALVVLPRDTTQPRDTSQPGDPTPPDDTTLPQGTTAAAVDLTLPLHTLGSATLLGDSDQLETLEVAAGQTVRLRLINTDQNPRRFTVTGSPFRIVAVDGRDLNEPTDVEDQALRIPAGGRYDVELTMPDGGVALRVAGSSAIGLDLVAPGRVAPADVDAAAMPDLDLLHYGSPADAADMAGPYDVRDTLVLDRTVRFVGGLPGFGYTVNGAVYPVIPATVVDEGDLVHLTVVNRGTDTHPMHPHGHHVLVLSRNGEKPTGAPLWLDTFDVQPGEVWEVALRADNPGIWMDHCHNLDHAAEGMLLHLAYRGVASPFEHGGPAGNTPE